MSSLKLLTWEQAAQLCASAASPSELAARLQALQVHEYIVGPPIPLIDPAEAFGVSVPDDVSVPDWDKLNRWVRDGHFVGGAVACIDLRRRHPVHDGSLFLVSHPAYHGGLRLLALWRTSDNEWVHGVLNDKAQGPMTRLTEQHVIVGEARYFCVQPWEA